MNTIEIKIFLSKKFKMKSPKISLFSDEIKEYILNHIKINNIVLSENISNKQKIDISYSLLKMNLVKYPQCGYKDCNENREFESVIKGFKKGCCQDHTTKLTNLEKYGVENPMQIEKFVRKMSSTIEKKFGCGNPMQSKECKERHKATMLEKYGVLNPSQVTEFQEKKKETFLKKYGVENPMKNSEVQDKTRQTNLKKYGVFNISQSNEIKEKKKIKSLEVYGTESVFQAEEIKEKIKQLYIKKYGVEHPMQNPLECEKRFKKIFKLKKYKWITGEISIIQGYEGIVLSELEQEGYKFNDILTDKEDIPEIWYQYKNKKRRYYPDIYIPTENLIIEVKSDYTLKADLEKNLAKFKAVKDAGYAFRLEVR